MKRSFAWILCIVMALSVLTGCASEPAAPSTPAADNSAEKEAMQSNTVISSADETPAEVAVDEERVLRMSVNAALEQLDPQGTNNINTLGVIKQIYEGLIYYDFISQTEEPRVAESFTASEDGLTWTFKLNPNAKFHNGDPVKASDVVFTYTRAMEKPLMNTYVSGIESVTATDESTVVIQLKHQLAAFTQYVSEVGILSEKFVTENGDNIGTVACGTGPYKVDSVDLATGLTASAFEDYYRGVASIRKVRWDVITDATAEAMALEAGDLDYLNIPQAQYESMKANEKLNVGLIPTYHTVWVTFNCEMAPFDNVLVRKAFAYLIDREAISIACFEGFANVDSLLLNPTIIGMPSSETLEQYTYEYNPEKGLELLREAGYDTTKEIDLGTIYTYAEGHYITKATPVIQACLAAYGIKLNIEAMETNSYVQKLYAGELPMGMSGGSYGADGSNYYQVYGGYNVKVYGGNPFCWSSDRVDELFEMAAKEKDLSVRQQYYGEIMQILYDECPGTGVGHKYTTCAWTKELVIPQLRMDYQQIYEWGFAA